jgi:hypothetical protein
VSTIWDDIGTEQGRADTVQPVREGAFGPPDATGAGFDLSFFATISAHLGSLADSWKREQDRRDLMARCAPQDYQNTVSGTYTKSPLCLDLGSVPEGRVWQVRRIVVGGPGATTAPTGKVFLYAQGAKPTTLVTSNVVDSWPSFTNGAQGSTYGTHQLFLVAPQHLWVAVATGTTGEQWVASVVVEDYDADLYYRATAGLVE